MNICYVFGNTEHQVPSSNCLFYYIQRTPDQTILCYARFYRESVRRICSTSEIIKLRSSDAAQYRIQTVASKCKKKSKQKKRAAVHVSFSLKRDKFFLNVLKKKSLDFRFRKK